MLRRGDAIQDIELPPSSEHWWGGVFPVFGGEFEGWESQEREVREPCSLGRIVRTKETHAVEVD